MNFIYIINLFVYGCNISSCCSDFFLGDHINQEIQLLAGSATVLSGSSSCQNNYTKARGMIGEFTIQEDSYISIQVNGALCTSGTGWSVSLDCSGTNNFINNVSIHKMMAAEQNEELTLRNDILDQEIELFPNPTSSFFTIQLNKKELQSGDVKLYDVHGKLVLKDILQSNRKKVNINNLPNGIYIVNINLGEETIIKKIIVSK